ncbi:MAG TPA: GTPase HflX [Turneriella sp.]|nr:GTPase HflX [Turneriella sp.]
MDASSLYQQKLESKEQYRALCVGQYGSTYFPHKRSQEESLRELLMLAETAGVRTLHELLLHHTDIHPANFFTQGQLERIEKVIHDFNLNLLFIDAQLKPNQLRNLEEIFKIRVLGRIEVILDIFAMRAKTREAILQVELAQLLYIMPRLKGLGGVLSRQGATGAPGIGTRGPGETMLETDRRYIRRRIQKIRDDLKHVERDRATSRHGRNLTTFALVGYTNVGKSSTLNALSSSSQRVFAEDKLFATLDTASRKIYLGEKDFKPEYAILTDTVGFIRNLPASLVAAFQSTLSEIQYADVIIEIHDASSAQLADEMAVVENELKRLNVADKPRLLYFNKSDLVFPEEKKRLKDEYPQAVWGNSLSKEGVAELRKRLSTKEKLNIDCR